MGPGLAIVPLETAACAHGSSSFTRSNGWSDHPGDDVSWHETMAREAEEEHRAFSAIWHLDRLIAAQRGDWKLYARRARAHSVSNKWAEAKTDLDRAWQFGPHQPVLDWQAHAAVDAVAAGRWPEAVWYLDRLIAGSPQDGAAYADRARVSARIGRPAEADADADIDRALKLCEDPTLLFDEADVLARFGATHPTLAGETIASCSVMAPSTAALRAGAVRVAESNYESFPAD